MRIALRIAYLGTAYHGWQVQPNAPTIQAVLQSAIEDLYVQPVMLSGCSRTDAGVHAKDYCCHFDVEKVTVPPEKLPAALNVRLPYDIVVREGTYPPDGFHARYSAKGKEYMYVIDNSPVRDPFSVNRAYWCKYPLDIACMEQMGRFIEGTRDFTAFKALGSNDDADPVRTVKNIYVTREGNLIKLFICADGFLYNMARIIAGTLLYAGTGKLTVTQVLEALRYRDRSRVGATLPAHGLYLNRVFY